jgi:hypothetical protein
MTLAHSHSAGPKTPTTLWLGHSPLVPSVTANPAACLKLDCSIRINSHQNAAGIRRLDQIANILAQHVPIGVSDQPSQLKSP